MNLVNPERSSHWYRATDQGVQAFYEMPAKKGGMRAPRIDDAKELGLLVSISRIAGMLPKPRLEAWKQEQAIYSALTLPRERESLENYSERVSTSGDRDSLLDWCYHNPPQYTEDVDVFAKRVVEDMEKQGAVAREFGSRIHAQIEAELLKPSTPCPDDLVPYMRHVREWLFNNMSRVMGVEQIVGDVGIGIGGKLDLLCELNQPGNPISVIDIKTQSVKNGKPVFYPEWPIQLAGYARCVRGYARGAYEIWPQLVSVVVDSATPSPVAVKVWQNPEQHWEAFLHCFEMFCYLNNYRPGNLAT